MGLWLIVAVVLAYAGCIMFVRHRSSVGFPLSRQLTDFSTFMVPFNLPAYLLSKVPNTPRIGAEHFPELRLIQDNWEVIRDEALALYQHGHIAAKDDLPASSFYKNGRWKSFYLKLYDSDIPSARALAPNTMALLDQTPTINIALFAMLMPGKKLSNHHDPFAYTLRYSLGLSTPNSEDCALIVDGEHYTWRDGQSIIFDETYFHSAHNHTDVPRIILMTDVDRPLHLRWVQRAYFLFGRFFNSLFAIDNLDSQRSGIGNRLGKGVLAYSALLKRIKHRNRSLYIVTKWLILLGLLGLLVWRIA